jgi:NAD(P)-dependent dehydrogenase (short-subunit alcohol dehydrogenase family)
MARFLVIAASSSIGQQIVLKLREEGHEVLTTSRNNKIITPDFILDATDFEAVDQVFEKAGILDGVINCSGSLLLRSAHLTTKEQYQSVVDASLTTAFAVVRSAGKHMMQHGGSIVLIGSAAALTGIANHEAIAAAKAGIVGLARSAAATYANNNLRFNVIAPGLVATNLTASLVNNEASRKISEAMHPLGRLGQPDDIARAAVFLLNPANSWITGQVLAVDGGLAYVRSKARP